MPCARPVAPKIDSRSNRWATLSIRGTVVDVDDEVIDLGSDPVELHGSKRTFTTFHAPPRPASTRRHPDHGAVARRHVVHVVGRHQRQGARHLLDDDVRITGDMSDHMHCKEPRPHVVVAAGGRADDDPELLAFVEFVGRLRRGRRGADHRADRQQDGCFDCYMSPLPGSQTIGPPFHRVQEGCRGPLSRPLHSH